MGREEAEPQHEPPYWTHDTSLCTGSFRSFGREPVLVRGKLHLADEPYRKSDVDLEIVPLAHKQGMSTYVNMRAYVLVPDITLTIDLYPTPRQSAAYSYIGKVAGATENPNMKEQEIGDGQAWYYPADKTIVLWECGLYRHVEEDYQTEQYQEFLTNLGYSAHPTAHAAWSKALERTP